jgi:hypothetical protein
MFFLLATIDSTESIAQAAVHNGASSIIAQFMNAYPQSHAPRRRRHESSDDMDVHHIDF